MRSFIRPSKWLPLLFPPSARPWADTNRLSEDIQLTHEFHSGGQAFQDTSSDWFSLTGIAKGADNQKVLISVMPFRETTRLLAASISRSSAGNQLVALNFCRLCIRPTPSGAEEISLDQEQTQWVNVGDPPLKTNPIPIRSQIIIPPEPTELFVYFGVGDNVTYRFTFLFMNAPQYVGWSL